MFLDGILNTGYTSPASATSAYKKQNEETSTSLPRSWGSDTVSVVDANTRKVVNTIKVGSRPAGIAVDQPTGTVYVANSGDGSISVLTPAAQ